MSAPGYFRNLRKFPDSTRGQSKMCRASSESCSVSDLYMWFYSANSKTRDGSEVPRSLDALTAQIPVVADGQFPLHSYAGHIHLHSFQLKCTDCALNHSPKAWSSFSCCGQEFITAEPHCRRHKNNEDKHVYPWIRSLLCYFVWLHRQLTYVDFLHPGVTAADLAFHLGTVHRIAAPCSTQHPSSQSRFMSKHAWSTEIKDCHDVAIDSIFRSSVRLRRRKLHYKKLICPINKQSYKRYFRFCV